MSLERYADRAILGKTDADTVASRLREEIKAGTYTTASLTSTDVLTVDEFMAYFVKQWSQKRGKTTWKEDQSRLQRFANFKVKGARLGSKPVDQIAESHIEDFLDSLVCAPSTYNGYLQTLKSASRFGFKKKRLPVRWLSPDDCDLQRRSEQASKRHRRLTADEERALLRVALPHLYRLIVAALETAARKGELLNLQWKHVNREQGTLTLLGVHNKTKKSRIIPITQRLEAILDMANTDPDGQPFGPDAYVFGDGDGHKVVNIDKAWKTAVLRGHNARPEWVNGTHSNDARKAYLKINLHFHDLRHEAGSRWLERGVPLHHIKELLGHANISQTDTYLNAGVTDLRKSMLEAEAHAQSGVQVAYTTTSRMRKEHGGNANSLVN